jgi:type 2A phosphatase activator TIP41
MAKRPVCVFLKSWYRLISDLISQHHHEGIKEVVKPFDWSYSTDFKGRTHSPDPSVVWQPADHSKDPIRTDLLSRPDPILFYDDVIFYEDELADNGIAIFSCKIRVMAERLLLLCRFFLRLDGVILRIRDTRIYVELGSKTVIRQYTAKEEAYNVVQSKLQMHRENIPEVLRDANRIAPLLRTVEDTMDKVVVP